jgi:acetyltransferase
VAAAVVISAGFKEAGEQGAALEQQLMDVCCKYHIKLLGPNCLGLIHQASKLNASFAALPPRLGPIAVLSQSGALGTAILDKSVADPLFGVSTFISLGNKADIDETKLMPVLADAPETKVILSYCESITDGRSFLAAAKQTTAKKPVVMLKSGTTESGRKAVASHTGSLAGSDAAYTAALKQAGIIRVSSLDELFDYGVAFAHLPPLTKPSIAILTNAGGPAILASDAMAQTPLKLAKLRQVTKSDLRSFLPGSAAVNNPVDVLGDALSDRYAQAIKELLEDPTVSALTIILTPQSMTEVVETAHVIQEAVKKTSKPIVACFIGEARVGPGIAKLKNAGIPVYPSPERAVKALGALYYYHSTVRATTHVTSRTATPHSNSTVPRELFASAHLSPSGKLDTLSANQLAKLYGLSTPPVMLATSPHEAIQQAEHIKYPVVLKIESPDIVHKTEFSGVAVNLTNAEEVEEAFNKLYRSARSHMPSANLLGCIVQKQVTFDVELFAGMQRDPTFGPIITFGLGGIWVEVLKEVSFAVAPTNTTELIARIMQTKAGAFFKGTRGKQPLNLAATTQLLQSLAQMSLDHPGIQSIDINPVLATHTSVWAADVRVIVK